MDEKTARDMDRLLAGGKLSGPEADAVLEHVLAAVDRAERERRSRVIRYWPVAAGAVLAAAAAVLLVVRGGVTGGEPGVGPVQYEEGAVGSGPKIEIRCADGTLEACPVTSSLVFAVSGNRKRVVLSAYAERVGAGDEAEAVFYFEEDGGGVEVAAVGEGARVAERAVRLTPGHAAGRYRVHAFVADRVLAPEEMRGRRGEDAVGEQARVEVVIVE